MRGDVVSVHDSCCCPNIVVGPLSISHTFQDPTNAEMSQEPTEEGEQSLDSAMGLQNLFSLQGSKELLSKQLQHNTHRRNRSSHMKDDPPTT